MDFLSTLHERLSFIPHWAVSLAMLALAMVLAVIIHGAVFRLLTRLVGNRDMFWRSLVTRSRRPIRLAFVVVAIGMVATIAPLTDFQTLVVQKFILLALIGLIAWTVNTALHVWTTVYLRQFKLDSDDNLLARKHVTQARILKRVATIIITTLAIGAGLMTFESVRQYGVSLLASAGAAGIIAGLALQSVLKNLFAGIQLAITQPIRIDDALLVEGEWGTVEEITSTYVVMRLWDWRRMILPLSYFIEKPFQNWTREDSALIGTVIIYLDYSAPVARVREKVEEIVRGSALWDRRVVNVQVTDFKDATMEVRIIATAASAGRAFDLRCEIREKLIAHLQATYPAALPRQRAEVMGPALERSLKLASG